MSWIPKSDILKILDATQPERDALQNHNIYNSINTIDDLHIFMGSHIFAVWDFMSIIKSLQKTLTCVEVPWIPSGRGSLTRLVNEIILEEESDIDNYGECVSHFEMYCHAMNHAGANTNIIDQFLLELESSNVIEALKKSRVQDHTKLFVENTFNKLNNSPNHVIASMFTFGREEVIPDMFRLIIKKMNKNLKGNLKPFIHYLDRHIGLDEDEHTPLALKMIKELCGDNKSKWDEATLAAKNSMAARIKLWDGILTDIKSNQATAP